MGRKNQGTGAVMEPVAAQPVQAPPGDIAQPPGDASPLTAASVREMINGFLKQLGGRPDADILSCQARSETPTATEYMRQVPPERQHVLHLNLRVVYQLG